MFRRPGRRSSYFFSPGLPASGSLGRVVFVDVTVSVPFIPSAAWSPTVQRNSYFPGASVACPDSVFPGPKIGVPPRSCPPLWTCRSCASEPLLRITKRTTVGWVVPLFTVTFLGSNLYSDAPKAIGWLCPTVTVSLFFTPSFFFLSPPLEQPASTAAASIRAGRGLGMAADNMPAHAEASPFARRLPRGLCRVRDRLRRPQDRRFAERGRGGSPRRDPVQRPLQRLPLARGRRRLRVEDPRPDQVRRAHRRAELQRAQGDTRGRALRDPQRWLLRRDHAGEHRSRTGRARHCALPRALRGVEVLRVGGHQVVLRGRPCST